jgi:hypothetical protein
MSKETRRPTFRLKPGQRVDVIKRNKSGQLTDTRRVYTVKEAAARYTTLIGEEGEIIQIGHPS